MSCRHHPGSEIAGGATRRRPFPLRTRRRPEDGRGGGGHRRLVGGTATRPSWTRCCREDGDRPGGCYGQYLGVLELSVDPESGRIEHFTDRKELKVVYSGPKDSFDPAIAGIVASYDDRFGTLRRRHRLDGVDLKRYSRGESNLGNLIADAMREAAGADIALMNSGGIRTDIPRGSITLEQLYTLLPFDNVLVSMDLTGRQLLQVLEEGARGLHGILQVSGLRVTADLTRPTGQRIVGVEIGGRPSRRRICTGLSRTTSWRGGRRVHRVPEGNNVAYGDDIGRRGAYLKKHSPVRPGSRGASRSGGSERLPPF